MCPPPLWMSLNKYCEWKVWIWVLCIQLSIQFFKLTFFINCSPIIQNTRWKNTEWCMVWQQKRERSLSEKQEKAVGERWKKEAESTGPTCSSICTNSTQVITSRRAADFNFNSQRQRRQSISTPGPSGNVTQGWNDFLSFKKSPIIPPDLLQQSDSTVNLNKRV